MTKKKNSNPATKVRAGGEGSVFEFAPGKWRAQIRVNGRYITKTRGSKEEAAEALHELRNELKTGTVTRGDLTISDLLDEWVARDMPSMEYVDGGVGSLSHIAAWRKTIGTKRARTIGAREIEDAMSRMRKPNGKPYSRETMTKRRSVLNQVFAAGIRRKDISSNPAPLARIPADTRKTAKRRAFSVEQAQEIIATTEPRRNGAVYLVGLTLGLRPGEIFGLRWDAIDFRKKTLRVQRGIRMTTGSPELVDELKTTGALRTIKLPGFVLEALRTHRDRQLAEIKPEGYRDHGLVFPNNLGGPMDLNLFRDWFRETVDELGFGDGWTTNQMRHTAASLLVARGIHLREIADILGHTTTKMLQLHYRDAEDVVADAHVEAMEDLFGGSRHTA